MKNKKVKIQLDTKQLGASYKMTPEVKEELHKVLGSELSESDSDKISVLFESSVNAKLNSLLPGISSQFTKQLSEQVENIKEDLTDKVSDYLDYVVEEWFDKNKEVISTNIRAQRDATLVEEIQKVFASNFTTLPSKGKSMLESLESKLKKATKQLEMAEENNMNLKLKISGIKCEQIFDTLSENLAETEKEKFMTLVEDLDINDPKDFETKAKIIREAHFQKDGSKKLDIKSETKTLTESKSVSKTATSAKTDQKNTVVDMTRALKKSRFA